MLSQGLLEELKTIVKEDYGVELKEDEAVEMGNSLISYFDILLQIKNSNEYENQQTLSKKRT